MKRVFFYSNHRENDYTIGITQKVHGEINALEEEGYEVIYSAYTATGAAVFGEGNTIICKKDFVIKNVVYQKIFRRGLLLSCCFDYLRRCDKNYFDLAYLRFHFFDYIYNRILKCLKVKGAYVVVEAHAYPYRLWKCKLMWLTYLLDIVFTPFARKHIDLVAIMGKEKSPWGITKTVEIDNGIDLNIYPLKKNSFSDQIRLISVSNEQSGHAYYKVVNGLYQYYKMGGKANIVVNLVGEYMDETKELISERNLNDRFVFWGKMQGDELNAVFDISDLGLGAFSFRKSDSGSCIKTKEYFARGIPFVNGWKEPAFDDAYPYVLRLETREEIVDFFKVVEFYESLSDMEVIGHEMRQFAKDNYSWGMQMHKVLLEVQKGK